MTFNFNSTSEPDIGRPRPWVLGGHGRDCIFMGGHGFHNILCTHPNPWALMGADGRGRGRRWVPVGADGR